MKTITIRQPWAAWIFTPHPDMGLKDIENRRWATKHRGPLAIHTAARKIDDDYTADDLARYAGAQPSPAWARGKIIGVVDLVSIRKIGEPRIQPESDWTIWEGWCHWSLANPQLLRNPIPYRGTVGLFDVPDDIIQKEIR